MNRQFINRALIALALINLVGGIAVSFSKSQFSDLYLVSSWVHGWLGGENIYGPHSVTDYPPWAIVVLSPIALIPLDRLPTVWVAVNLVLGGAIVWRLATISGENPPATRNLACLLAATSPLRALAQFSQLSFALAMVGAFAESSAASTLLIGLSLMKPQIGGVVLLWLLLRRQWARAASTLLVPVALTLVFVAATPIGLVTLASGYRDAIAALYIDPTALPGHSDLRFWLWHLRPAPSANLLLSAVVLIVLLAPAVVTAFRPRANGHELELLGLCGAISLLAVRHLSYDFLLLLPALVAWRRPPFASAPHAPRWRFFGLAALLVAAVPSWARLAVSHGAPESLDVLLQFDRVMCVVAWAALAWRLNQSTLPQLSANNVTERLPAQ